MRILVTGGGCEEPIDGVRFVANLSTGGTAARITETLLAEGHDVTLLAGLRAERPVPPSRPREGAPQGALQVVPFRGFAELETALEGALNGGAFGLIVHAAAVSDYSVESVETDGRVYPGGEVSKLDSSSGLTIRMKPNPKLVDGLRARAGCPVVAFKLTKGASESERLAAVSALFSRAGVDYVISNDITELWGEQHRFLAYRSPEAGAPVPAAHGHTRGDLARFIAGLAGERHSPKEQGGITP